MRWKRVLHRNVFCNCSSTTIIVERLKQHSRINWKINFYSRAAFIARLLTGSRDITDCTGRYTKLLSEVDACSSALRDIVALLIFIKRSSPSAVFRSKSFRQLAHNENKISCLNFTRIIMKRCTVTPRKNTLADYDGQLCANVTGKKQKAFLFVPFFSLFC